jgi:iron complex transport system ATP-binding protein
LSNGKIHSEGTPSSVINAQAIKEVYGADVYVYPHPLNKLPTTFVAPHKNGGGH